MSGPDMSDGDIVYGLGDLAVLGARIAAILRAGDVIGLSGDLGAGKTTLARAILAALGLQSEAPSPSFAIVQPYGPPETRLRVLHIDLYRIDDPNEIAELGLFEARDESVSLIEWPERMGRGAPADMLRLGVEFGGVDWGDGQDHGRRRLTAAVPPGWEARWPPR